MEHFNEYPPEMVPPSERKDGRWFRMSWKDIFKKNKTPMDRVSTTASKLPQDEEAAERTKKNEADLLAEIMARNKKVRGEKDEWRKKCKTIRKRIKASEN